MFDYYLKWTTWPSGTLATIDCFDEETNKYNVTTTTEPKIRYAIGPEYVQCIEKHAFQKTNIPGFDRTLSWLDDPQNSEPKKTHASKLRNELGTGYTCRSPARGAKLDTKLPPFWKPLPGDTSSLSENGHFYAMACKEIEVYSTISAQWMSVCRARGCFLAHVDKIRDKKIEGHVEGLPKNFGITLDWCLPLLPFGFPVDIIGNDAPNWTKSSDAKEFVIVSNVCDFPPASMTKAMQNTFRICVQVDFEEFCETGFYKVYNKKKNQMGWVSQFNIRPIYNKEDRVIVRDASVLKVQKSMNVNRQLNL